MRGVWLVLGMGALAVLGNMARAQGGDPPPSGGGQPGAKPVPAARAADEIAAVVGDTPIFRTEVEEQVQAVAEQMQVAAGDTAAYRRLHQEVLERLINDQLLLLEAKAQNIKVEGQEVDQAVDDAVQNNIRQLGGIEVFRAELQKEGLTEEQLRARYREDARKQMLTGRLVQKEIRPKIAVSDSAVARFFEENRSQLPKRPRRLQIQDLFIRTRPDSVMEQRILARAQEVRQKIQAGLSFSEAAATYSDDPRGKEGGALGRLGHGDMDPEMEKVAFSLAAGEVSQPVHTAFGYHLLQVTAKDPAGEWVELNHIVFAVTPTRSDEAEARQRAQQIKDQVKSGKLDLAEAVRLYSDDPASKARDGIMDWIPIDNFYGDMKQVIDTLRVGRIAGPVAGDGGYHVFKVLGEQAEGEYAFNEIQDQMRQLAMQQAMEQELQTYVDKLRQKYFVEVRAGW